jgi:PAS domain S-box-containing protein
MPLRVPKPLSRRLPLLIALLLCVIVGGISIASYFQVRRAMFQTVAAHLDDASHGIAGSLNRSLRLAADELGTAAGDSAVVAFTSAPTRADRGAAMRALDELRTRSPQLVALSIRNHEGAVVLASGSPVLDNTPAAGAGARRAGGRFVLVGDSVFYAVFAPIRDSRGGTLGMLVGTRRLTTATGSSLIGRLLGKGGRLAVGNAAGGVWTDLSNVIPAPSPDVLSRPDTPYVGPDGQLHIGARATLSAAPWTIWVETTLTPALADAHAFLWRMLGIALVFIVGGVAAAALIVRRALAPLRQVQLAAETLASDGQSAAIESDSDDEIGSLARSFNTMGDRIRLSREELVSRAAALEQRNRALHESELRYRQLVDLSPDAIIVHRNGIIVFANAVAAALFGATDASALYDVKLLDVIHPDDRESTRRRMNEVTTQQRALPLAEIRFTRLDDGRPVLVEVTGAPVLFDGEQAIQTLARDISGRRFLEEQLRQSQKMEAVGRLAGGIAHDFNNILTVISSYAELMLAATPPDDPQRAGMDEIRRAAASAARLTRQMLAFSRKQVLAPRRVLLDEAIIGLTGMLQRMIGENVVVSADVRAAVPPIWADIGQLEQVLLNLAVNARDAMPDGGALRIETGMTILHGGTVCHDGEVMPSGNYVTLAVRDTGTGMSADVRARIFEPFFTTKAPGQGTGLGLATVYGIVKQSGGFIMVDSTPGEGSTFTLYFPPYAGEQPAAMETTGEWSIGAARSATVLLVEDDAVVRRVLRRMLEGAGHTVLDAASAADAIRVFAEQAGAFDLVITDMMMRGQTGAELVRDLRQRAPELRAIVLSGYSEELAAGDWQLPQNVLFLQKPISSTQLIRHVSELLGYDADLAAPAS